MEWIVLGGGESGVGAALLAQKKGLPVFLSDRGALSTAKRAELLQAGIDFEEGEHDEDDNGYKKYPNPFAGKLFRKWK